jgi:hypothetical protein
MGAGRRGRLGTEKAFSVLAKVLEAEGVRTSFWRPTVWARSSRRWSSRPNERLSASPARSNGSGRDSQRGPGPSGSTRRDLLAYYQGVRDHAAETLVVLGGEDRDKGHQV